MHRINNFKNMNNVSKRGLIMAVIGFLMLVFNAINYIFDFGYKNPAFTVLGIVFVVVGMKMRKKE